MMLGFHLKRWLAPNIEYCKGSERNYWLLDWHMPECCGFPRHINVYSTGKTLIGALVELLACIEIVVTNMALIIAYDLPRTESFDEGFGIYKLYVGYK